MILLSSLASVLFALGTVLIAGAAQTQSRWLLPLVFLLPPLVTLHLCRRMTARSARILTVALALPWLVVLAALPAANRSAPRQIDFATLDASLPRGVPVVSSQTLLLGNLVNIDSPRALHLLGRSATAPASGTRVVLLDTKAGLAAASRLGYVMETSAPRSITLTQGRAERSYQTTLATAP